MFRWAFEIYDEDNSGMIDQREMNNVMSVGRFQLDEFFIEKFIDRASIKCLKGWAVDHREIQK